MRTVTLKLLVLLLAIVLVLPGTAEMIPGDANSDSSVDILDLVAIIDNIVSGAPFASKENADANKDGVIDILDLVLVIDSIVNGGGKPNPTTAPTAAPTPTPLPTPTLPNSKSDIAAAKRVQYISNRRVEHTSDYFTFYFEFLDSNNNRIKSPAMVDLRIVNNAGILVYSRTHIITMDDYTSGMSAYINIYEKDIQPGNLDDGSEVDDGKLNYKIYYPGIVNFDEYYLLIFGDLPYTALSDSCSLVIAETPIDINYYSYSGKLYSSTLVTGVSFEFEDTYGKDQVHLNLYFTGEKTYDSAGPGQSSSCKIGWKLMKDGYVVKSGTHYTPSLAEGEKYLNSDEIIYYLEPGNYELKLLNVN